MDIESQVRKFILENFMYSDDESRLPRDLSLVDNGIVDSTGVLELVEYIEGAFSIQVEDTALVPENFDSVAKLTAYIQRKISAG
jgi:acyl carrier protein